MDRRKKIISDLSTSSKKAAQSSENIVPKSQNGNIDQFGTMMQMSMLSMMQKMISKMD